MSLAEFQESLKGIAEDGEKVLAQLRRKPPAASTQAAMLLFIEEAQAALAGIRRELQQTLVEATEGQRGEHDFGKGVLVTVTTKAAKRKFDDHGVLDALKQHVVMSRSDLSTETVEVVEEFADCVERAAYVGYWRTTALREFDVDVDEVSSAEAGVPTVSVSRRASDDE